MSDETDERDQPVASRDQAVAMLAQFALSWLWSQSDFQPHDDGIWGCCHVCCAPCAALDYLDRSGVLDEVLAAWPYGLESDTHVDGRVDRRWMHRQWSMSEVQESCGHRWLPDGALDLRRPLDWLKHPDFTGRTVKDCDGWTFDEWQAQEPVARDDFSRRLAECTVVDRATEGAS